MSAHVAIRPLDYTFFRESGSEALGDRWSDAIAVEYAGLDPSARLVLAYPAAGPGVQCADGIGDLGDVVYAREFHLDGDGAVNLMRQVYLGESWAGTAEDDFAGARAKAEASFGGGRRVLAALVVPGAGGDCTLAEAKQELRATVDAGQHALHTTDSHEGTIRPPVDDASRTAERRAPAVRHQPATP